VHAVFDLEARFAEQGARLALALKALDAADACITERRGEVGRLRSVLFKVWGYIAGERTLDRPKEATLEIVDRVLTPAEVRLTGSMGTRAIGVIPTTSGRTPIWSRWFRPGA
jgi:hypothetical protein